MPKDINKYQATIHGVRGGKSGTMKTIKLMAMKARGRAGKAEGAKNPIVRHFAIRIVRSCKVKDYRCEARSILTWVQKNIRWTKDVLGVETVATPEKTLLAGGGDCDDLSTLTAALALSVGMPVRFKAIAADPSRKKSFSHVYVEFNIDGEWVPGDPSRRPKKINKLGWESPRIYMEMTYPKGNESL